MKKFYTKKLIAFVLALAMVLTGGYATTLTGTVAKAAAKKATLKLNPAKLSLTEGKKKTVKIKKTNVILEYGKPIYIKDLPRADQKKIGAYTQNIIEDTYFKIKDEICCKTDALSQ